MLLCLHGGLTTQQSCNLEVFTDQKTGDSPQAKPIRPTRFKHVQRKNQCMTIDKITLPRVNVYCILAICNTPLGVLPNEIANHTREIAVREIHA